jgi:hypothetical protein
MRDPDAVAVVFGEHAWRYGELWEAVRAEAAELSLAGSGRVTASPCSRGTATAT